MNIIDTQNRERIPVIYIAGGTDPAGDTGLSWLKAAVAAFAPQVVAEPEAILIDNMDYGRLDNEALNEFLVDADIDAVVWPVVPETADTWSFAVAVCPYPKVKFQGRKARTFTLPAAKPGDPATGRLLAANVISAALAEIVDVRPVCTDLIAPCVGALEDGLKRTPQQDPCLQTIGCLQTFYFALREDARWKQHLRRAVELNGRLLNALDKGAHERRAELLVFRAKCLAVLGGRNVDVEDILAAITALKRAAPHVTGETARAGLDMILADCKAELGTILDDNAILISARDLLRGIIPVLYSNLAIESWAMAQSSLSAICWKLYSATGEFEHATDAVDAVHEALTVYNPKLLPSYWAMAKNNLGGMLCSLGGDPENIDTLHAGIDCLHDALSVYSRDTSPMDYAMTTANLAESLCTLAGHTNDPSQLALAETYLRRSLAVHRAASAAETPKLEARLREIHDKISAAK